MAHVVAILAGGGSTRIPRKNEKKFCETPLVAWPIGAVLFNEGFDE